MLYFSKISINWIKLFEIIASTSWKISLGYKLFAEIVEWRFFLSRRPATIDALSVLFSCEISVKFYVKSFKLRFGEMIWANSGDIF